ncbi:alpha/beta hydrolase [Candidatus Saccharibacteria bacterium]|nr:alpha/beta hydrolase [Candidatus Saccharibacteria bacterium]
MTLRETFSMVLRRYLRVPYTLNTYEFASPKKPKATVVLVHGIGNSLHAWDEVVARLPNDIRVIGVDLLGFGGSPKPAWAKYSASTQARALGLTLASLRLTQQPIIVGHSLGALVAIETARRYGLLIKQLLLCNPPFYRPESEAKTGVLNQERILRELYRVARKHPEQLQSLSPMAVKLGLANKALNITGDNVSAYVAALEASIINQTSLRDVRRLQLSIRILYGAFDPVVIKKHIVRLGKDRKNVTVRRVLAGHEITGSYVKVVAEEIAAAGQVEQGPRASVRPA